MPASFIIHLGEYSQSFLVSANLVGHMVWYVGGELNFSLYRIMFHILTQQIGKTLIHHCHLSKVCFCKRQVLLVGVGNHFEIFYQPSVAHGRTIHQGLRVRIQNKVLGIDHIQHLLGCQNGIKLCRCGPRIESPDNILESWRQVAFDHILVPAKLNGMIPTNGFMVIGSGSFLPGRLGQVYHLKMNIRVLQD